MFSAVLVGIATSAVGIAVMAEGAADVILDGVWAVEAAPAGWPAQPRDVTARPLGRPAMVAGNGTFAYLATQDGSADPVAYSPCQPIHVVVNARTAVPTHDEILQEAVTEVSRVSGLQFVFDGGTTRIPERRAPKAAPDGGWEPVLVAWSDADEVPELAGEVAGVGGSARVTRGDHQWLVTGSVILDGPDLADIVRRPDGRKQVRDIVMHEFGHLLGLDHVSDRSELMYDKNVGKNGFGPGDKAGLATLGSGRCIDW